MSNYKEVGDEPSLLKAKAGTWVLFLPTPSSPHSYLWLILLIMATKETLLPFIIL